MEGSIQSASQQFRVESEHAGAQPVEHKDLCEVRAARLVRRVVQQAAIEGNYSLLYHCYQLLLL